MGLGTFISAGRSLETTLQRVELAESLGYESTFLPHIAGRDSVTALMAYAARSSRIKLGTGIIPIYVRSPVSMAQSFATLDEFSGGRAICGLGVSHRPVVENWYGEKIEKPLRDTREYVAIVRAIFRGEDPPPGKRWQTVFHFMDYDVRADIPIYLAGLSPGMLRLAGEIAEGVILWLCNPDYIRDVVVPAVAEGRAKAGRPAEGFDIVAAVPAAVTAEPDRVRDRLRTDLIPYFSLPFYRTMIEGSGYGDDIAGFDRGMQEGGPAAAIAAISDRFVDDLAAIGDTDHAASTVRRYAEAGATSPCVGGVPGSDYDATLRALASCLA